MTREEFRRAYQLWHTAPRSSDLSRIPLHPEPCQSDRWQTPCSYQESYKRPASIYAANGYDAARFLDSALHETKGDLSNVAEFQRAARSARFESVRGAISLGRRQHVVQDWYMTEGMQDADGEYRLNITRKLVTGCGSRYADQCPLKIN